MTKDQLAKFQSMLEQIRDEDIATYRADDCAPGAMFAASEAGTLRRALYLLHLCSDGEYGARFEDQPSPFKTTSGEVAQ